jgi:hypothetical protein
VNGNAPVSEPENEPISCLKVGGNAIIHAGGVYYRLFKKHAGYPLSHASMVRVSVEKFTPSFTNSLPSIAYGRA